MGKINLTLVIIAVIVVVCYPFADHYFKLKNPSYSSQYMFEQYKTDAQWNLPEVKKFILNHPHRKLIIHPKSGATTISLGHFLTALVVIDLPPSQGNLLTEWADKNTTQLGQKYILHGN